MIVVEYSSQQSENEFNGTRNITNGCYSYCNYVTHLKASAQVLFILRTPQLICMRHLPTNQSVSRSASPGIYSSPEAPTKPQRWTECMHRRSKNACAEISSPAKMLKPGTIPNGEIGRQGDIGLHTPLRSRR
jgi:hypothetical protein